MSPWVTTGVVWLLAGGSVIGLAGTGATSASQRDGAVDLMVRVVKRGGYDVTARRGYWR